MPVSSVSLRSARCSLLSLRSIPARLTLLLLAIKFLATLDGSLGVLLTTFFVVSSMFCPLNGSLPQRSSKTTTP